jgi:hypothetical protein
MEKIENLLQNSTHCVCKHCGCNMTGYPGDDECSDCAFGGVMGKASAAARKAVEEQHFQRTGEKKTAGEIFRSVLGM